MGIIDKAIQLYQESGHEMHWFDFYMWGVQNNRYGFQRYIDKALHEQAATGKGE